VVQRSELGSTISTEKCKRCLANIDALVETLAEELGFVVVVVHLNTEVPQLHQQIYLFLVAQLIVGMHGGAWGSALVTSVGQAAVEVLPKIHNTNAEHIVSPGGAVYEASLCLTCTDSKSLTGEADIPDVLLKAKKALCVASKRSSLDR
jgi:capsular polysaccharide biosynthesis protein